MIKYLEILSLLCYGSSQNHQLISILISFNVSGEIAPLMEFIGLWSLLGKSSEDIRDKFILAPSVLFNFCYFKVSLLFVIQGILCRQRNSLQEQLNLGKRISSITEEQLLFMDYQGKMSSRNFLRKRLTLIGAVRISSPVFLCGTFKSNSHWEWIFRIKLWVSRTKEKTNNFPYERKNHTSGNYGLKPCKIEILIRHYEKFLMNHKNSTYFFMDRFNTYKI